MAQGDVLPRREAGEGGHHVFRHLGRQRLLPLRRAVARLEAAQLEQVLHEGGHPVGVGPDLAQEALRLLRLLDRAVLQRLHETADRGERRAQLVGSVGHEVAPDVLEPPSLGRVVEGQDRAVRRSRFAGEGHHRDGEDASQLEKLHLGLAPLPGAQDPLDERADLALPDHLEVVAAESVAEIHGLLEARVGEDHGAPVVHREDSVVHGGEDGVGASPVAGDLRHPPLQLVGGLVDDARQLAELVVAADPDAGGQVALGILPSGLHDLLERAAQRGREQDGEARRREEREGEGQRRGAPEVPALLLDRLDARGRREPTPTIRPPERTGTARVEELGSHGGAAALGARSTVRRARPCTSGRSAWFAMRSSAAPEAAESATTRPSGRITVTRAFTSRAAASTIGSRVSVLVPPASACSTTWAMSRASAVRVANASSRARRSREGPARRRSTARATPAATTAVRTMRPRSDRRLPHPSSSRAIR